MAERKTGALGPLEPEKAAEPKVAEVPPVMSSDHTLGKIMAAARERLGLSQSQASTDSNIPAYYLEMIENDDYSAIADQLYLLPFLRRYAVFIKLDPEEVASRFIRDVQRADMNATRMSDPIAMIERRQKSSSLSVALIAGVVGAVVVLGLAWLVYRLFFSGPSVQPTPEPAAVASPAGVVASPAAIASPAAQIAPQAIPRPVPVRPQLAVPQALPQPQRFQRNGAVSASPMRPGYPPAAHPPLPPPEPDTE